MTTSQLAMSLQTNTNKMETFPELYEVLLQTKSIKELLNNITENGDRGYYQEAIARTQAFHNCIKKLKNYKPSLANIDNNNIIKESNLRELYYDSKNNPRNIGGNGGCSSDLTMIDTENNTLLVISSKVTCDSILELDIEKMGFNVRDYEQEYKIIYGFFVDDKRKLEKKVKASRKDKLKEIMNREETIKLDWNDLEEAHYEFQKKYKNKSFKDAIYSEIPITKLSLYFHQELTVYKTLQLLPTENSIVWGHVPRSGKSYIMGGAIRDHTGNNYFIVTMAKNETYEQYLEVFDIIDFNDYNVRLLEGDNIGDVIESCKKSKKNIVICSSHYLKKSENKSEKSIKRIRELKDLNFDIIFFDEAHYGGSNGLTQTIINYYGANSKRIYVTASYNKPMFYYGIKKECCIKWDAEDIELCKNINRPSNIQILEEKHGKDFKIIFRYEENGENKHIIDKYSEYPKMKCFRLEHPNIDGEKFSMKATFLGTWDDDEPVTEIDSLKNNAGVIFYINCIFGEYNKETGKLIERTFKKSDLVMEKYKTHVQTKGGVSMDTSSEPIVMLAFLPAFKIAKSSECTKKLLEKEHPLFMPKHKKRIYNIVCINHKDTENAKKKIESARQEAKKENLKGVLVLCGKKCHLGVSLKFCDIVILLNDCNSHDMVYQMKYRCMTEAKDRNKQYGYVFDLCFHSDRHVRYIVEEARKYRRGKSLKESIKYYIQDIMEIDIDDFDCVEHSEDIFDKKATEIYNQYLSNYTEADNLLRFMPHINENNLTDSDKLFMKKFYNIDSSYYLGDNEDDIRKTKRGIISKTKRTIQKNNKEETEEEQETEEEEIINPIIILRYIIPLIILLSFRTKENLSLIDMYNYIQNNDKLKKIFIKQINISWKNVTENDIKRLMDIYKMEHENNQINDIDQRISDIREIFISSIDNKDQLSKLVDKYLVPTKLEERSNAEVSTHYELRQEMLDTIPIDFWKTPNKIFEPCSGKGGFLVDIINRFMIGLKDVIQDEDLRYKTIVEECLYFSDINDTNIFICKLLTDPYDKYKLNYYIGDTLSLDIKEKWGLDTIPLTIGNPPYNEDPDNGNNNTHKKPVYQDWIYKFAPISDRLLLITPSRWFTSNDKLLVKLREYMKTCNIEFIEHKPMDDVFKGVKIKGGVSYFLINKNYNGKVKFNSTLIDINKYDIIVDPKYYSLLNKLNIDKNLSDLYCSQGTFLNSTTEKKINDDDNGTVCYVSYHIDRNLKKYIPSKLVSKKKNYWKVVTPSAAYKGPSGFRRLFVSSDTEVHSRSYISFKVSTKEEAENLLSYMSCKLVHVLLSLRKQTHGITHKNVLKWIPLPSLNEKWDDNKLHKYFNLDSEQIEQIKNMELDGCYNR